MKVYFISRGYPTTEYKMHGIFEMDQAIALAKAGVDVVFLSLDLRSFRRRRKLGRHCFVREGVKVYSLDWPIGKVPKSLFYRIGAIALNKLYEEVSAIEGRPDVLHAYFTDYAYLAAGLKRRTGIPLVVTEPNSHINVDEIQPTLRKAAAAAYEAADVLISVSPDFQRKLQAKFGVDSIVNSILPDLDLFEYREKKPSETFTIVSTGRLSPLKGMRELIEAFAEAFPQDPKVKLIIFGGGPEEDSLRALIQEKGLTDRVDLRGMVHREEIAKGYGEGDLFCLYSHMETFGLAYLEALAAGLPVLSSACGGPEHLIHEGNGKLIPLFDHSVFVEALREMRNQIGRYDGAQISREAKQSYSVEKITGGVIDCYHQAIRGNEEEKQ